MGYVNIKSRDAKSKLNRLFGYLRKRELVQFRTGDLTTRGR